MSNRIIGDKEIQYGRVEVILASNEPAFSWQIDDFMSHCSMK
jgi:hypothetical protein